MMYQFSKDLLACCREQDLFNSPTFLPPFPPLSLGLPSILQSPDRRWIPTAREHVIQCTNIQGRACEAGSATRSSSLG